MSDEEENEEVVTYDSPLVKFKKKNHIRTRGRPKKITLMPANEEARVKKKKKKKHLKEDSLLNQIEEDPDSIEVYDEIMRELAEENSNLGYERGEAIRRNEDTTRISSKKVTALKSLSEVYSKKRSSLVDDSFDFESERFDKLIEFFFGKIRTAAQNANFKKEKIAKLFDKISKLFDEESGWKKEAKEYIEKEGQ